MASGTPIDVARWMERHTAQLRRRDGRLFSTEILYASVGLMNSWLTRRLSRNLEAACGVVSKSTSSLNPR